MRSAAATLRLLGCYKRGTRRRRRRTGCARRTRLQGERSTRWRGSRLRIRLDLVEQRYRHVAARSGRELDRAGLGHRLQLRAGVARAIRTAAGGAETNGARMRTGHRLGRLAPGAPGRSPAAGRVGPELQLCYAPPRKRRTSCRSPLEEAGPGCPRLIATWMTSAPWWSK